VAVVYFVLVQRQQPTMVVSETLSCSLFLPEKPRVRSLQTFLLLLQQQRRDKVFSLLRQERRRLLVGWMAGWFSAGLLAFL
jgi:hypothetical protein